MLNPLDMLLVLHINPLDMLLVLHIYWGGGTCSRFGVMIRHVIPMYQIIYSSSVIKRCIFVDISFLCISHCADIINNILFFLKKYYFNIFLNKKIFKKTTSHYQTLSRLASIRGLGSFPPQKLRVNYIVVFVIEQKIVSAFRNYRAI